MTATNSLQVLPYVALCSEKSRDLEGLLAPLRKEVRQGLGPAGVGLV